MKILFYLLISLSLVQGAIAQTDSSRVIQTQVQRAGPDTVQQGYVIVNKDPRIDLVSKKLAEYYLMASSPTAPSKTGYRNVSGYRLMIMSSTNRNEVLAIRQKLIQSFPGHKPYVIFQNPFMKLKFGDFLDRKDADRIRKQIQGMKIVSSNIYIVPEKVTIRVEKLDD